MLSNLLKLWHFTVPVCTFTVPVCTVTILYVCLSHLEQYSMGLAGFGLAACCCVAAAALSCAAALSSRSRTAWQGVQTRPSRPPSR
jgi:hypothetical protein